jgi:hypothetical protein
VRVIVELMYPSVVTLLVQSETTTWHRTGAFLPTCAFILAAYTISDDDSYVRAMLGLAGALLSFWLILLMRRGRQYVAAYVEYGKAIERALAINIVAPLPAEERTPPTTWQRFGNWLIGRLEPNHDRPITGVMTDFDIRSGVPARVFAVIVPSFFMCLFILLLGMAIHDGRRQAKEGTPAGAASGAMGR